MLKTPNKTWASTPMNWKLSLSFKLFVATFPALSPTLHGAAHHEYTPTEARKHIGETATVVGKVECTTRGRTYRLLQMEGCNAASVFDIVVWCLDKLEGEGKQFEGATIAVTGQIERFQDAVQINVRSPSQIARR